MPEARQTPQTCRQMLVDLMNQWDAAVKRLAGNRLPHASDTDAESAEVHMEYARIHHTSHWKMLEMIDFLDGRENEEDRRYREDTDVGF